MDYIQERLVEADSQYSDLVEQLATAKTQWLEEEDPAIKKNLKIVYDDIMGMLEWTNTRITQLEAGLRGTSKLSPTSSACTISECPHCRCVRSFLPNTVPHAIVVLVWAAWVQSYGCARSHKVHVFNLISLECSHQDVTTCSYNAPYGC